MIVWVEKGKTIFSADKMHENMGPDVYSSRREERKKKRAYDAEHSCIARQYIAEYLEKMDVSAEQRYAIKFCVRLKKMPRETIALLKEEFGKKILGDSTIRQWHKAFVDGRESAEFELWGGVPQTIVTATNINTITAVIVEDRHLTIQALISRNTKSKDNESVKDDEQSCFFVSFFLLFLRRGS